MKKIFQIALSIIIVLLFTAGSVQLSVFMELTFGTTAHATSYTVGDIIKFGSYPQSKVTNKTTLSALNKLSLTWKSYGYYSGNGEWGSMKKGDFMKYADVTYNSNKYRAVKFTKYRPELTSSKNPDVGDVYFSSYQYENGYKTNVIYWFKYEPLKWRILDPSSGLVMCENIIDSQAYSNTIYEYGTDAYGYVAYWNNSSYTTYANDYASSSIRKWLNNDFYNTAFTSSQKSKISSTTLDNSAIANTALGISSAYAKEYDSKTTTDKVYLLSWSEISNKKYGFNSVPWETDKARRIQNKQGTDYAKCQGLGKNEFVPYSDDLCWRLRSAGDLSYITCNVYGGGMAAVNGYGVNCGADITSIGIRPAIRIQLSSSVAAPAQVKNLKVSKKTSTTVTLQWSKASGAQKYIVYKYNPSTKKYSKVATTKSTSYKVTGLKNGTKYTFAVKAIKTVDGTNYSGKLSSKISVTTTISKPAQVKNVKVSAKNSTSVTLQWSKTSGAQKYYIFRYSNSGSKKYTCLGSTAKTSYKITGLKSNTSYKFAVQASKTVNKKEYYGKVSSNVSVTTSISKPAQVKNVKVSAKTSESVTLQWVKSSGAQKYYVFSYNADLKKYTCLGNATKTSYKITKLKANTSYKFAVQAAKTVNKKEYYGKVSEIITVQTLSKTPNLTETLALSQFKKAIKSADLYFNNIVTSTEYPECIVSKVWNPDTNLYYYGDFYRVEKFDKKSEINAKLKGIFSQNIIEDVLSHYIEKDGKLYSENIGGDAENILDLSKTKIIIKKSSSSYATITVKALYRSYYNSTYNDEFDLNMKYENQKWVFTDKGFWSYGSDYVYL